MDKLLTIWQNMTTEQLVITLLIVSVVLLFRWLKIQAHENQQRDKLVLLYGHIIKDKLGITTVKIHRNGDYEIVQPLNDD